MRAPQARVPAPQARLRHRRALDARRAAQLAAPELELVVPETELVATVPEEVLVTELETVFATELETVFATELETVLATELETVPATLETVAVTLAPLEAPSSGGLPTELVIRPTVPATAEPGPEIVEPAVLDALEMTRTGAPEPGWCGLP